MKTKKKNLNRTEKQNVYILQLENDDPKKEMEFEVNFMLSLTEKQRYKRMMELFKSTLAEVKKVEYSKAPAIVSR